MGELGTLERVALHMIDIGPQIRKTFDERALCELADGMAAAGQIVPVGVRPTGDGRYRLVQGERRVRAARLLGWTHIDAIVREADDEASWLDSWMENACRVDINPVEQATAMQDYMDRTGLCAAELARKIGLPETTLRSRLLLLRLPAGMQQLVASGEVPAAYGELMGRLDRAGQWRAWEYLLSTPDPDLGTFRRLCKRIREGQTPGAETPAPSPMLFPIEASGPVRQGPTTDSVVGCGGFPARQDLPPMPKAASVGAALSRYIAELSASTDPAHREAALVAGAIYNGLRHMYLIRK